ncbi:platelet endothelial aggregation receptor 1-like [Sorex fumeus]|uniref:platelet endothelial aggregation receptor 1-like n=1 Tax=Sorex fumeus TaxID=62283 RepID=UPI0024AE3B6C|nr:platelet endothelial aggregation receptor 1-like [Sorex fumeus]
MGKCLSAAAVIVRTEESVISLGGVSVPPDFMGRPVKMDAQKDSLGRTAKEIVTVPTMVIATGCMEPNMDFKEYCPKGVYGAGCTTECQCVEENTLDCDAKNGSCTCKSGYQGNRCQKGCPEGTYGPYCQRICKCLNGGSCDTAIGTCDCPPGFIGADCNQTCPEGYYEQNCTLMCFCGSGQCDPATGECQCPYGQVETRCQQGNNDHQVTLPIQELSMNANLTSVPTIT